MARKYSTERCARCGANASHANDKFVETCTFIPPTGGDWKSPFLVCDKCGYPMRNSEDWDSWFENGWPRFNFCPECGRKTTRESKE